MRALRSRLNMVSGVGNRIKPNTLMAMIRWAPDPSTSDYAEALRPLEGASMGVPTSSCP